MFMVLFWPIVTAKSSFFPRGDFSWCYYAKWHDNTQKLAMITIKPEVVDYLERRLKRANVPESEWADRRKWVRYYLDFCAKHGFVARSIGSLGPFLDKLKSKGQDASRCRKAEATVRLLLGASSEGTVPSVDSFSGEMRDLSQELWTRDC